MLRAQKTRSQRSGSAALIAAIAAIAAIAGAVQLAAPQPAAAAEGLQLQRTAASSVENDDALKGATAPCPTGKVVVGGGGAVWSLQPTSARLTTLLPTRTGFLAQATTAGLSGGADWRVDAYAVCANQKAVGADPETRKYTIVGRNSDDPATAKFKTAQAPCPPGTVAYGSGAAVTTNGRTGLQMNRTSGPLDISRATGRADNGYRDPWTLTSWAICGLPAGGVHSEGTIDPGTSATHRCTPGNSVAGPGGGGGLVDGGTVWLKVLYPFSYRDVDVEMTGFFPDHQVLAQPTCANGS